MQRRPLKFPDLIEKVEFQGRFLGYAVEQYTWNF